MTYILGTLALSAVSFGEPRHALALSITSTNNPIVLTNTILGSGISIVGVPTYTGAAGAAGTFTGGIVSGIGMESGIILTSGSAASAVGPNTADSTTTNNGQPGDTNLNSLIPLTQDAASLQFQFTTGGGNLFFNYVFASEEYNEFTNSAFNDVFGFFLDGQNIALIPGTTTPVSINNVNGGNPLGTNASNPQFYNNNDPSDGVPFFNIAYDGFTDVFTAQVLGLSAGTHTIKLAIADVGDFNLDSAVFIQAGSFSDTSTNPVPEPGTWALMGTGLVGLLCYGWRRKKQTA